MKITPSQRQHAMRPTNHHMNWTRKSWVNESELHREVRGHRSFSMELPRYFHDYLHTVIEPLDPPLYPVAEVIHGVADKHFGIRDDAERVSTMLTTLGEYAHSQPDALLADNLREAMCHYAAQLGIYALQHTLQIPEVQEF